ncbi:unnamed protein product [Rotaria magnacalcarata]|uniref:Ig-like domain-containing protein n=3 Tax=Rotaria magnacalcarata TaxID=392030 RepID=A0A820EYB7_9BILA|nr:unnamed protein product [Rotaria magnacalcarata]CAF4090026.1 unnamed protein product [Rotaria magnacalcarata]CAF4127091.1 unnamed protein product [Rotaria magnacalcarata]CAF4255988.1 unnamed protein product [Rotaria magnacalcarata]
MQCPAYIIALLSFISHLGAHHALAIEQQPFELSTASEQEHTITSVLMQSVILPCKAILLIMEPDRVMWYKITNLGQSSLSVDNYLITKDSRLSVAYYSFDHGLSPAKWDLHITDLRLSDAARYQCHVIQKDGRISARSNVKLVVEDVIVRIQPSDALVSVGDKTEFSCNFTGKHRILRDKITWLKDGKPITSDTSHVTTSTELVDATVTVLHITASRPSDSGSYRCSDGHSVQSKEARLYLRDDNAHTFLRSLSSATSSFSKSLSSRTVFRLFIFLFFSF